MNAGSIINELEKFDFKTFQGKLLDWYDIEGRKFPWRNKSASTFKKVVTEILLQRTKAETVADTYHSFFKKYPSWNAISKAPLEQLQSDLMPIGLWRRRASTLNSLSLVISSKRGRFPKERVEIENLPGIGQYIANSILLLCHGESEPLLDGNMARVLERHFGPRKLVDIRYDPYLQWLSKKVVSCRKPIEMNWAILDLAALICTIRNPKCKACPFRDTCFTYKNNSSVQTFANLR